jgi:phage/plasmid-associated DNA primase
MPSFASDVENTSDNDTLKQIIADLVRAKQFTVLVEEALPGLAQLHQAGAWDWFELLCKQSRAGIIRQALLAVERYRQLHPEPIKVDEFIARFQSSTEEMEDGEDGELIGEVNQSSRDPHRLADLILENDYQYQPDPEIPTLHFWSQTWWIFNGRCYDAVEDDEFRSRVNASIEAEFVAANQRALTAWQARKAQAKLTQSPFLEPEPRKDVVTTGLVNDVVAAILTKNGVRLSTEIVQPDWLYPPPAKATMPDPRHIIASGDGLCNYNSLGKGTASWAEHTPRFFSAHCLPFSIKSEIATPGFDAWLADVFEEDPDLILMYHQVWGITLSGSQDHHYIPVFSGEPRGGKGLSGKLMKEAIGERYTAALSLATLHTDFALQQLIGRKLAIDFDARLSTNRNTNAIICDRLLKLSSFDPVNVNRKGIVEVSMTLPIRLLILTNRPLQFRDTTLSSRLKIIPFKKSWLGKEDPKLLDKLRPELPGIIRRAARWYHEFLHDHHGQLFEPEAARVVRENIERAAYPLKDWFETCCESDPAGRVASAHLRKSWDLWCLEHHRENNASNQSFWADLHQLAPNIKKTTVRVAGTSTAGFAGIKLKIQDEPDPNQFEPVTTFLDTRNKVQQWPKA